MYDRDEKEVPPAPNGNDSGVRPAVSETASTVAAPAAVVGDELSIAQAKIEQLEREKKDTYDRLLRTAADFDNFRKRSRRDAAEAEDRGRMGLLKALLPIIDNLERAVAHQAAPTGGASTIEGVKLILRMFQSTLEQFEVRAFESLHRPFDPQIHEAVSQAESADHPVGTVVEECQRGYNVGAKLLRPAMVVVAKAKVAPAPSEEEGSDKAAKATNGADEVHAHSAIEIDMETDEEASAKTGGTGAKS